MNAAPTTAQDLVNDVMSGRATLSHLESSAPQPALLFGGSELPHSQGHNIWSASHEEKSLKFSSQPNHSYQPKQFHGSSTLELSPTIWSSYSNGAQNTQPDPIETFPPTTLAHPTQPVSPGHYRALSTSVTSQHFQNHHPSLQDPFAYPQTSIQPPIHRPDVPGFANSAYMSPPSQPNAGPGTYYQSTHVPGYHSHHLSVNDPRLGQHFPPPSMSQLWGNVG